MEEEQKKDIKEIPEEEDNKIEEENEEEEKKTSKKTYKHHMKKIQHHIKKVGQDPWKVISGVLAIMLLISIFSGGSSGAKMSAKDAEEKAIAYIAQNLVQGGTAVGSDGVEESGNMYRIKLDVAGNKFDSYVTKDGKMLFPTGYDMTQEIKQPEQVAAPAEEMPKTDKPKVELFVMSFCPYGNKAEDTMYPVYQLLKDKVDWQIRYIVSVSGDTIRSLHGQPETDQNIREVCVKKYYGLDAFWKFLTYVNTNCGSNGACWEDAAVASGVDADKIQTCYDEEGLDLMKEEAAASAAAGASGSPTMLVNGQKTNSVYSYGQSESYKSVICSAFTDSPEECAGAVDNTEVSQGGSC